MTGSTTRRWARIVATAFLMVLAGLAGVGTASADASADPSFGGTLYLADANTLADIPVGASLGWNQPVSALPAPGDQTDRLTAPSGAESVVTFVSPVGHESDPTSWNATAPWELTPPGQWLVDVTPYHLVTVGTGTPPGTGATAAVSGDYSLGVAYLAAGGHVADGGLYFIHIHLTGDADPEKATYTWAPVDGSAAPAGGGARVLPAVVLWSVAGVVVFLAAVGVVVLLRRRRAGSDRPASGAVGLGHEGSDGSGGDEGTKSATTAARGRQ
ncbi:hypothetical protein ACPPVS_01765 [Cellulomonas sp. McL0617]|uniref:hypothetical protein n=1 Tax=Cellulomonas sp. McL0617 TaxID=3415675 RepID=UPI003CE9FC39